MEESPARTIVEAGGTQVMSGQACCSCSILLIIAAIFPCSPDLIRVKANPNVFPSTQRTIASSIMIGQSRSGI